jgi:hypothetical protein
MIKRRRLSFSITLFQPHRNSMKTTIARAKASLTASNQMLQSEPWTGDRRGLLAPVPPVSPSRVLGNQKISRDANRNLDVFPLETKQPSTFQESIQQANEEFVMWAAFCWMCFELLGWMVLESTPWGISKCGRLMKKPFS